MGGSLSRARTCSPLTNDRQITSGNVEAEFQSTKRGGANPRAEECWGPAKTKAATRAVMQALADRFGATLNCATVSKRAPCNWGQQLAGAFPFLRDSLVWQAQLAAAELFERVEKSLSRRSRRSVRR
jgi:hypothetical protein